MKKLSILIFRVLPVIVICLGGQLYIFGQQVITSADIQAGTSVFVFKQPKKFFNNQTSGSSWGKRVQQSSKAQPSRNVKNVRPASSTAKPQNQNVGAEPIAPEDWINEQADNAIEERKVSDSEPFLSLTEGYLNSRAYFCESPQFPDVARKAKKQLVSSKVLVTVAKYGGVLQAKTLEGDETFRSNVYNTLGSINFRQSFFMGKPIRIEGMLNFTQNPGNTIICRETTKEVEIPTIIDGEVLNAHAMACEFPEFPADAKTAGLKTVESKVQVIVDEQGKVIFAKPMSGHTAFSEAAQKAAIKTSFPKSSIAGKPVKVRGILEFSQNANNEIRCGNAKTD